MNDDKENETAHAWLTSLRSKRKAAIHNNNHEYHTHKKTEYVTAESIKNDQFIYLNNN